MKKQKTTSSRASLSALCVASVLLTAPAWAGQNAPQGANNTLSLASASTVHTFVVADFGFSDPNDAASPDSLKAVLITTLPTAGSLLLAGTAVTAGQFVSAADIAAGRLTYQPAATGGSASFTFQVQDTGNAVVKAPQMLVPTQSFVDTLHANQEAVIDLGVDAQGRTVQLKAEFLDGVNNWAVHTPNPAPGDAIFFGTTHSISRTYLDIPSQGNVLRDSRWSLLVQGSPASVADLSTSLSKINFFFGVAGMGGEGISKTIRSDQLLTVIGNAQAFGTNVYSWLSMTGDPSQPYDTNTYSGALGHQGYLVSTNTEPGSNNINVRQDFSFFALPEAANSITLTEKDSASGFNRPNDPGGITFGLIESNLANTLDASPKTMTLNAVAAPVTPPDPVTPTPDPVTPVPAAPVARVAPVPVDGVGVLALLVGSLAAFGGARLRRKKPQ